MTSSKSEFDGVMGVALEEARASLAHDDVPVGALIVRRSDGEVLARRHNERERAGDPTAHAELLAITDAAASRDGWRLDDCALVVTLEPCPMCAGAALLAASRSWSSAPPTRRPVHWGACITSAPIPGCTTASRSSTACAPTNRRRCSRSSSRPAAYNDRRSEGCESGRIGWSRKPLWRKSPWVQIPVPPPPRRPGQVATWPGTVTNSSSRTTPPSSCRTRARRTVHHS